MIRKTFFERLETLIRAMVWTGTPSKIFGDNVFVVSALPTETLAQLIAPVCFIVEAGFRHHPEHPNIIEQDFNIEFLVENVQSEFGRSSVLGSNRITGTSAGAGSIDIEKEFLTQIIETVSLTDSVQIIEESAHKASKISGNLPLFWRVLSFSVMLEL